MVLPSKSRSVFTPASLRTTSPAPPLAAPAMITNFSPLDLTKPLMAGFGPTNAASIAPVKIASTAVGPALNELHSIAKPTRFSNCLLARA